MLPEEEYQKYYARGAAWGAGAAWAAVFVMCCVGLLVLVSTVIVALVTSMTGNQVLALLCSVVPVLIVMVIASSMCNKYRALRDDRKDG